ncbi:YkgJ family cysteine cluster protein [Gemmiger sp.]|uniref:YkgJ family cysteine cluster protein n=1 Tax=Gemmiger sp. TaxID=2049027 RepID=UPI003079B167
MSAAPTCCPLPRREIVRLRDYAKKHQLKEHRLPAGAALESVDLTCPFRNETTKRCEVYPVRPLICRAFICSRTLQAARKTRDLVQSDRDIHSLRWEIFKNPESIALIQAAQRAATEK